MAFDSLVTIETNHRLCDSGFVVTFRSPRLAAEAQPGQFVMLGFPEADDPLLRRPYSVYRIGRPGSAPDTCEVQYKIIGRGTARLASMRPGETLQCLGPLGRGFEPPAEGRVPLLVAGGIGSAGVLHQAAALVESGHRPTLLFGCRDAEDLPLVEGFDALRIPVEYATEDGCRGTRGLVTTLLEPRLAGTSLEIYACGPQPMLRAVARIAAGRAGCQVAMESHMACGFGVCLGCVVPAAHAEGYERYVRVCAEGPVFRAEELEW
jgi:dihydroorotate dehydrogenase electron transfer subunit